MDYAMRQPWWLAMAGREEREGRDPREGRRERRRGRMGPPGFEGPPPFGPGRRGPHRGPRARRGDVRQAILALLAEEARNGYQIIQLLEERTAGSWRPSPGAVYPALSQLEDERLIEAFDNEGQRAFRLTDAGRQAAEGIEQAPWEAVNAAHPDRDPGAIREIWGEFGHLADAARAVATTGSADDLTKASAILVEARKKLYNILADQQ